jgi:hypothetical protein
MKKQLLIAAIAASMTSVAMADISISGSSKVNAKGGEYKMEADVTVTGKSGDTSVVAQIGLDNSNTVEQLYATSSVAGISVKVGGWKSGKGELGQNANPGNRVSASTSFGGVKLSYTDKSGNGGTDTAISGTIAGVKLSHKVHSSKSETKASGSMGGVSVSAHTKDYDAGGSDTAVTLKTEVQGVSITYVDVTSDAGTTMDGYIGKTAVGVTTKASSVIGLSTSIAGNKVTFKSITSDLGDDKKLIVTRKLTSGATFEATYVDSNNSLDLELAVKF